MNISAHNLLICTSRSSLCRVITQLEVTQFQTELLEVEVQELTSRLEVTEADLTKTRKKCKKLSLELSEVIKHT